MNSPSLSNWVAQMVCLNPLPQLGRSPLRLLIFFCMNSRSLTSSRIVNVTPILSLIVHTVNNTCRIVMRWTVYYVFVGITKTVPLDMICINNLSPFLMSLMFSISSSFWSPVCRLCSALPRSCQLSLLTKGDARCRCDRT